MCVDKYTHASIRACMIWKNVRLNECAYIILYDEPTTAKIHTTKFMCSKFFFCLNSTDQISCGYLLSIRSPRFGTLFLHISSDDVHIHICIYILIFIYARNISIGQCLYVLLYHLLISIYFLLKSCSTQIRRFMNKLLLLFLFIIIWHYKIIRSTRNIGEKKTTHSEKNFWMSVCVFWWKKEEKKYACDRIIDAYTYTCIHEYQFLYTDWQKNISRYKNKLSLLLLLNTHTNIQSQRYAKFRELKRFEVKESRNGNRNPTPEKFLTGCTRTRTHAHWHLPIYTHTPYIRLLLLSL